MSGSSVGSQRLVVMSELRPGAGACRLLCSRAKEPQRQGDTSQPAPSGPWLKTRLVVTAHLPLEKGSQDRKQSPRGKGTSASTLHLALAEDKAGRDSTPAPRRRG